MGRNSKDNSLARYEEVIKISVRYNDFISHPRFRFSLGSVNRMSNNQALNYVRNVRKALDNLKKEDKNIIFQEFFNEKAELLWWRKHYTKSTYYRKRGNAIKHFLESYAQ